MDNQLEIDDHSVFVNATCEVRLTAKITYNPNWENGDFDYEGPQGTATHRVGLELQECDIETVDIVSYTVYGNDFNGSTDWIELAFIDNEKLDNGGNKDFIQWLEKRIEADCTVHEQVYEHAREYASKPEPDYDY